MNLGGLSSLALLMQFGPKLVPYHGLLLRSLESAWKGHPSIYAALPPASPAPADCRLIVCRRAGWVSMLRESLAYVKQRAGDVRYVFSVIDDHCPLRLCDEGRLDRIIRTAIAGEMKCVVFVTYEWPWAITAERSVDDRGRTMTWNAIDVLEMNGCRFARVPKEFFRYNQCQPGIWEIDYYLSVCDRALELGIDDPWGFESMRLPNQPQHYVSEYAWPSVHHGFMAGGRVNAEAIHYARGDSAADASAPEHARSRVLSRTRPERLSRGAAGAIAEAVAEIDQERWGCPRSSGVRAPSPRAAAGGQSIRVMGTVRIEAERAPVRITPAHRRPHLGLAELWEYRELLYFLIWRDVKVRYKQTVLGAAWAIIQPLSAMAVFTLFFGLLAKLPSNGLPYPVFYYSALLPWLYFAGALQEATNAMTGNRSVITRVYFPRLILPLASVLAPLVDFAVAFTLLIGMMLFYGLAPSPRILLLPAFLLLAMVAALAMGLWLAALNAMYRDVRYVVPFLIQLWMFASPVAYPSSLVPEAWRWLYGLNPMVGVIEGFRWTLLGQGSLPLPLGVSILSVVLALVAGLFYFRRVEGTIVDLV